jgi:exosortase
MKVVDESPSIRSGYSPILFVLVALAAGYWFVFQSLVRQWWHDPNYTHGIFVIPMAAVLAWRRRKRLLAAPAAVSGLGIPLLVIGQLLYLLGVLAAELFTLRFSLVLTVFALVLLTQGRERTRVLLLPCAFLLFMIPLPYIVYYKVTFPLQIESAKLATSMLSLLGVPAVRSGNIIDVENYSLEVVTACSGLRSMMSIGTIAVFMSDFFTLKNTGRVILVLLVIPIAIFSNTLRLVAIAVLSLFAGAEAADGFLHELSGIAVFLVGFVFLLLVGGVFEWIARRKS